MSGNPLHIPGRIAYHTSCVYKENMYLFGGNLPSKNTNDDEPNEEIYADKLYYLNLRTMSWSMIRTRGDQVLLRDVHTAVVDIEST